MVFSVVVFFSSAVSEEEHAVLRSSSPLGGVKLLKMEVAEIDVGSVFFNDGNTKRHRCAVLF